MPCRATFRSKWADHPTLRSTFFGGGEPAALDHPGVQPLPYHSPGGERAKRGTDVTMVEPVERRLQVAVQHPQALRVGAAGGALPPDQVRPGGTRRLTATGPYFPLEHPTEREC